MGSVGSNSTITSNSEGSNYTEYKGFKIEHDNEYYKVIAPDGRSWTANTLTEAKEDINEEFVDYSKYDDTDQTLERWRR